MTGIHSSIQETAEPSIGARKAGGGWDDAKFEQAKALAADGKKAREIADILGGGITRSAVICKLRRANVELKNAPAGGREVSRKGITKGKGYRAAGKTPRSRRRDKTGLADVIGSLPPEAGQILIPGAGLGKDFDGEMPTTATAIAVGYGEATSGSLGLRRGSGIVMVGLADEAAEWDLDRVKMARQLIEDKGFVTAEAARQMGVTVQEMRKVCATHGIRERGFDAMKLVRAAPVLTGLVAKETPTALDLAAQSRGMTALAKQFDAAQVNRNNGEPISILDVGANDCRYMTPIKDKYGLATFCGCQVVAGKSYCAAHCEVVFEKKRA